MKHKKQSTFSLVLAIDRFKTSHNSLQYNVDRFAKQNGNTIVLPFSPLLLCTYVPAICFTLRFSIPPVRTYTAKHRKTPLYQVLPQPPHP